MLSNVDSWTAQMFQDNAVSSEIPLCMIGGDALGEKSTRFSAGVPRIIALTQWLRIAGGGRYSDGLSQKLMQTISAADPHFLDDIFVIQHYGVVWFAKTLVVDREVSIQYSDLNQQPYQNIIRECWIYSTDICLSGQLMKPHFLPHFQNSNWDLAAVGLSGKCPSHAMGGSLHQLLRLIQMSSQTSLISICRHSSC
jgi:hypothetical protein